MMAELLASDALAVVAWGLLGVGSVLVVLLAARTVTEMLRAKVCVPE